MGGEEVSRGCETVSVCAMKIETILEIERERKSATWCWWVGGATRSAYKKSVANGVFLFNFRKRRRKMASHAVCSVSVSMNEWFG